MPQRKKPTRKKAYVVGRSSFAKISAVEGIRLTPEMKKRATKAKREKLSPEEFRASIVQAYRKA